MKNLRFSLVVLASLFITISMIGQGLTQQIKRTALPKTEKKVRTAESTKKTTSSKKNTSPNRRDRSGKDEYGREYVDLGLPGGVLWATCNVGASKPEDYGLYFAWGETVGYAKGESHDFSWANYKWCNGGHGSMTKYCTSSDCGIVDNKTVLDPEDDAATANWGAGWRMPTVQEIRDLYDSKYTTTKWVTVNGVSGRQIMSKSNGNTIFLPAAGYRDGVGISYKGADGFYSSRELYLGNGTNAYFLCFYSGRVDCYYNHRYRGRSVRPVRVASE